jgi:hypothetical protein
MAGGIGLPGRILFGVLFDEQQGTVRRRVARALFGRMTRRNKDAHSCIVIVWYVKFERQGLL